jgi:hypothetical protein
MDDDVSDDYGVGGDDGGDCGDFLNTVTENCMNVASTETK